MTDLFLNLPTITVDGAGVIFYVCPMCVGRGTIRNQEKSAETTREWFEPCGHCFGFGRLPCPSWYREQAKTAKSASGGEHGE